MEVLFTTKGTPDEVRKRVEKEATYVAAGIAPPPHAGSGPPEAPAAGGSRDHPRPAPPAPPATGLKGLWSRITGR